jgi:hypothetical protein
MTRAVISYVRRYPRLISLTVVTRGDHAKEPAEG